MNNILFVLLCLNFIYPMLNTLHIFQQNRYEVGRYHSWLINDLKRKKIRIIGLFVGVIVSVIIYVVVLNSNEGLTLWAQLLFVIFMILSIFINYKVYENKKKTIIKPLVFTSRVKRQIFVITLLQIITHYFIMLYLTVQLYPLIILVSVCTSWILMYLVAIITSPIEKIVKKYFVSLAKKIIKQMPCVKVGITGSFGKTSSKNVLQAILSEKYYSLMTPASFNTPMGITITIREQLKAIHEVFICEMGADHVGEIDYLSKFIKPKFGVVTSIGPQHLNTFGSLQNIIKEKMCLIENLDIDGVGIINLDNQYIRDYHINNQCKIVSYGIASSDVDYQAINIVYSPSGSKFDVVINGEIVCFETKLLGEHNIANILAAICVGLEMDITCAQLVNAVKKIDYIEHRLQVKKINGYTFIDNAFNSNPSGSKMSLEVMKMMPNKRYIITPGMIDLGKEQFYLNKEFGKHMLDRVDFVVLVGINQTKPILEGLNEVGFNPDNIVVCKTVKEAFGFIYQDATIYDTILLENDLPDAFNN